MEKKQKVLFWSVWTGMLFFLFILSGCIGQTEDTGGTCPDGLVLNKEFGVCCPVDSEYNPDLQICEVIDTTVCPEGHYLDDNDVCQLIPIEVVCPEMYWFDPAAGVCIADQTTQTVEPTVTLTHVQPPITITTTFTPFTPDPNLPVYTPACEPEQYEDIWGNCIDPVVTITTNGETITSTRDMNRIDIKFGIGSEGIFGIPLYLILAAVVAIGLGLMLRKKK